MTKIGSKYTGRIRVEDLADSSSLGEVPSGGSYQATCQPSERLHLSEILIYDFTLVELYVGNYFIPTKEYASVVGSHAYHVGTAGADVLLWMDVRIHLKNETDRPRRVREANFELERRP